MHLPLMSSDGELRMLADLIQERTGLQYEPSRMDLLADRIAPIIAERGFQSLLDYYYYLRYDPLAAEEWQRLHSALAVNETYFWREFEQIKAAAEIVVPKIQREQPGKLVRIWHAASASGEEPYSTAIALERAGCYARGPIEITATDFNPDALAEARQGIYRKRSFRSLPAHLQAQYFSESGKERFQLDLAVRERVQFKYLNLLDEAGMASMRNYDIIFCRNAFIYFSDVAIQQVVKWFYQSLNPAGVLFVAAAESLLRLTHQFDLVEIGDAFAYVKRQQDARSFNKDLFKWDAGNSDITNGGSRGNDAIERGA